MYLTNEIVKIVIFMMKRKKNDYLPAQSDLWITCLNPCNRNRFLHIFHRSHRVCPGSQV